MADTITTISVSPETLEKARAKRDAGGYPNMDALVRDLLDDGGEKQTGGC